MLRFHNSLPCPEHAEILLFLKEQGLGHTAYVVLVAQLHGYEGVHVGECRGAYEGRRLVEQADHLVGLPDFHEENIGDGFRPAFFLEEKVVRLFKDEHVFQLLVSVPIIYPVEVDLQKQGFHQKGLGGLREGVKLQNYLLAEEIPNIPGPKMRSCSVLMAEAFQSDSLPPNFRPWSFASTSGKTGVFFCSV